jgi:hypothetical protein
MSLLGHLDSIIPRDPFEHPEVATSGDRPGAREQGTTHLLVYNDPEDPSATYGQGWTLVVWHGARWRWSMALAARGASASCETRVAQAVAVRVLADQGVQVESWSVCGYESTLPTRRAVLRT